MIHDPTPCSLGEGPIWHPERGRLYWFDILSRRMLTEGRAYAFDREVSAAGWIDRDRMLVASETDLFVLNLETEAQEHVADLEAANPATRSNDGRADPMGGFWIGTMGKDAQAGAGAIYRLAGGTLRMLFDGLTITNAICFDADGRAAYFCDTVDKTIRRVTLDPEGWPDADPTVHIDMTADGWSPDGAVIDAEGCLWSAQWGAGQISRYAPDGAYLESVGVPAPQPTCPAFGGADMRMLFVTSATDGIERSINPHHGMTFALPMDVAGRPEPRVIL
ncbi:MAG: SMP-30/gluconolactonase/LRE family protein [Paracoccaceae bacterium]